MKTLIAEDDFVSRVLVQRSLDEYGTVIAVANGQQAVDAFHEALRTEDPFDLVCLDIMMPEMDGLEALQKIRELEQRFDIHGLQRCKIMMITALGDTKHVIDAFKSQCEGYLVKPFEREDLIAKLVEINALPLGEMPS